TPAARVSGRHAAGRCDGERRGSHTHATNLAERQLPGQCDPRAFPVPARRRRRVPGTVVAPGVVPGEGGGMLSNSSARTTPLAGRSAVAAVLLLSLGLGGCELAEGIFRVGLWAGVILVLLVVALIWLISRLFR